MPADININGASCAGSRYDFQSVLFRLSFQSHAFSLEDVKGHTMVVEARCVGTRGIGRNVLEGSKGVKSEGSSGSIVRYRACRVGVLVRLVRGHQWESSRGTLVGKVGAWFYKAWGTHFSSTHRAKNPNIGTVHYNSGVLMGENLQLPL